MNNFLYNEYFIHNILRCKILSGSSICMFIATQLYCNLCYVHDYCYHTVLWRFN